MKRTSMLLMLLLAVAMKSHRVFAQSVTVTLMPGWTWISCPSTDTLDFATALGSFTPAVGDVIESQFDYSEYIDGEWFGGAQQFYPGYGYLYFSNRNMPVFLTFNTQQPAPQVNDHEYVDLGLPSGTLWATCNVGANAPEEYGDYFAWGETQPKVYDYSWNSYQYCIDYYTNLTKYCNNSSYGNNGFTDTLTIMLPEDDAAMVNWGNAWRMPTMEEWLELRNNTTYTWTTQNGVEGLLFAASNGNTLFLPAAGNRSGRYLYDTGSKGYYWSSSLSTQYTYSGNNLCFAHSGCSIGSVSRNSGRSVRPVRSAPQSTSFVINVTANPVEGGVVNGSGGYLVDTECTLTATCRVGYTFSNWSENGQVVSTNSTYAFMVTSNRNLVANFTYNVGNDHTYVDLGLPSGTLWATCNLGADAPEEYGDYFAWGETQPKTDYGWDTYQYCIDNYTNLTKYCNNSSYGNNGFTDNLTILLPEDDAATVNWGNAWRMPTKEECQELRKNTTYTWTTQNGVEGLLFAASNGNTLFLPAAGYRFGSNLYGAGNSGDYGSSSLSTQYTYCGIFLFFGYNGSCNTGGLERSSGRSVRPVRSTQ